MIRISQLKLSISHTKEDLEWAIIKKAGGRKPKSYQVVRRSIDARKKPDLYYIYTVDASFQDEKKIVSLKKSPWFKTDPVKYLFPRKTGRPASDQERPVIIGAGPAGLFAGLALARGGYRPIICERGDKVEERDKKTQYFFRTGELDEETNIQFGEGGAGTFSDGKLNTMVKDKSGRNHFVLEEFVKHGAPEEILYEAKPHVGTDILKEVVASIREEILSLGGEICFRTKMTGIVRSKKNPGRLAGVRLLSEGREREVWCRNVILAIGHSARDTFAMLDKEKLLMTPKAFAIGVRVEHPARMINESQYGTGYPPFLPAASYKLTHQCEDGRGVYTFCMCPGGYVVNASSEKGRLCVNGMSNHGRDGRNSNSAVITTVTPKDFPGTGPLAGLAFQRKYEELAYQAGGGKIPVQLYGDFRRKEISRVLGTVTPDTKGMWSFADLNCCLPDYVSRSLIEGMTAFGQRIRGYDGDDVILAGVETRTSSPLRIERDSRGQGSIEGLFPCGEGAGYAGGITSAAMDGLKMAEAVARAILEQSGYTK